MPQTSDLGAYRRHADRFGTECVWETASTDLGIVDLGRLSLWLQRLDRRWRPPTDRAEFAGQLIDHGEPHDRACQMAMVSRRTLRRRAELPPEVAKVPDQGSNPLISRGADGANRPPPTKPLSTPHLATSGAQNGSQAIRRAGSLSAQTRIQPRSAAAPIPGQLTIYDGGEAGA